MFADLARARFTAFFFVMGLALMVVSDLSAAFETPREPLAGEAMHLVGIGILVTSMLESFTALVRDAKVVRAVAWSCHVYFGYHVLTTLALAFA